MMLTKKKIVIGLSLILSACLIVSVCFWCFKIIPEKNEKLKIQQMIKQYREEKLKTYAEENSQFEDYEIDVAFLGDSLTDGYAVEEYYSQFEVSNRGIGGDTTFDLENRLDVSLFDLKPKVAVLLIGANNFRTMFENYERIVQKITSTLPNTKLVLLSLTAMGGKWGKNNEIACFNNVKIKLVAEKYNCEFVDLFTPLLNPETNEIFENFTSDGGHLTSAGYEVLTAKITPVLESLIA